MKNGKRKPQIPCLTPEATDSGRSAELTPPISPPTDNMSSALDAAITINNGQEVCAQNVSNWVPYDVVKEEPRDEPINDSGVSTGSHCTSGSSSPHSDVSTVENSESPRSTPSTSPEPAANNADDLSAPGPSRQVQSPQSANVEEPPRTETPPPAGPSDNSASFDVSLGAIPKKTRSTKGKATKGKTTTKRKSRASPVDANCPGICCAGQGPVDDNANQAVPNDFAVAGPSGLQNNPEGLADAGPHGYYDPSQDAVLPGYVQPDSPEQESGKPDSYSEMINAQQFNSQGVLKKVRCKQCNHMCTTKADYWAHTATHLRREKMLKCPRCPFATEYKHHLEYHLRNHFGSKPYKCKMCPYSCVNKSMLNSHLKSHSNVYQFRCADCTYVTKYCHSLKLHLRKHVHSPAPVLNADGTPNPYPIIDVYGTRRGPKARKGQSSICQIAEAQPCQVQHQQQQQQQQEQQQQQQQQQPQQQQPIQAPHQFQPFAVPVPISPPLPFANGVMPIPQHFNFNAMSGMQAFNGFGNNGNVVPAPVLPFFGSLPYLPMLNAAAANYGVDQSAALIYARQAILNQALANSLHISPPPMGPYPTSSPTPPMDQEQPVDLSEARPLDLSKPAAAKQPANNRRKGRAVKVERRPSPRNPDEGMDVEAAASRRSPSPVAGPSNAQPEAVAGPSWAHPDAIAGPSRAQPDAIAGPSRTQPEAIAGSSRAQPAAPVNPSAALLAAFNVNDPANFDALRQIADLRTDIQQVYDYIHKFGGSFKSPK